MRATPSLPPPHGFGEVLAKPAVMCPTPHPPPAPVTGEANAFYATLRGYSAVISSVLEQAATVVESESSCTAATATLVQFSSFKESQVRVRVREG